MQNNCCIGINYKDLNHNSNTIHTQKQTVSVDSDMNSLLMFCFWVHSDTRSKTQFLKVFSNHTMLTIPNARLHLMMLRYLTVEIRKTQLHVSTVENSTLCLNGRNSTLCLHGQISTSLLTLFQNPQILRTISSGRGVIHTPASFPVWGFIMTMVIVISFARERKLLQLTWALNSNSSKPNQTKKKKNHSLII